MRTLQKIIVLFVSPAFSHFLCNPFFNREKPSPPPFFFEISSVIRGRKKLTSLEVQPAALTSWWRSCAPNPRSSSRSTHLLHCRVATGQELSKKILLFFCDIYLENDTPQRVVQIRYVL